MDREKLKNYLKRAMELEKNKFELEQTLANLNSKKYVAQLEDVSRIKVKEREMHGLFAVLGAVAGFFLCGICGGGLLALIICVVVGFLVGLFWGSSIDGKKESRERAEKESEVKSRNEKVSKEVDKKNSLIVFSSKQFDVTLKQTQTELEILYSLNFIYPKYRNFVAIASIYEYLDSGRCTSLEGADGAYNLYEMELRLDKIITGIDRIIYSLEAIKNNQYYLYSAIKEITPQIEKISNSIIENTEKLNEIAVNSEVTAYTTKVIERNQYYGRSWNDGKTYHDRIGL